MLKSNYIAEMKFCTMMIYADVLHKRKEMRTAEKARKDIAAMLENDNASFLKPNFRAYVYWIEILSGKKEAAHEWLDKYAVNSRYLWPFIKKSLFAQWLYHT